MVLKEENYFKSVPSIWMYHIEFKPSGETKKMDKCIHLN